MKKLKTHSLRFRMVILLLLMMVLLIGLVTYNNYSAYSLLLKKVYGNTEDTTALFQKQLDDALKRNENNLFTTAYNSSFLRTLKAEDMNTVAWFNAAYQLQLTFQNALSTYTIDGMFCYLPDKDQYIAYTHVTGQTGIALKNQILKTLAGDSLNLSDWTLYALNNNYYFLRVLHINEIYVGAWIDMDTLLGSLAQTADTHARLYFMTYEGLLLRNDQESIKLTPPDLKKTPYAFESIEGENMLAVSKPLTNAPFYLTILIPQSDLTSTARDLVSVILIVSICLLLIWLLLAIIMRKWILTPVEALTKAIGQLRSGNLDANAPTAHQLDEFQNMTTAFNEMVTEIKDLKIDVYERKLQKQRLEAQYLKQQITPHFMINCLNTTYQLTETGHEDLARKMLKDLSSHLRFILSSGQTVSLGEELRLVENYIELSGIRYPYSIRYICQCDAALHTATVIPLLLLNFVENTIKYEVRMGQILEIHIEIEQIVRDQKPFLKFFVWDTGNGFSADMLDKLVDIDAYLQKEGEHIGIANVVMRARHVFDWSDFKFSNRNGGGAQINIELPSLPFTPPRPQ